MMPGLIVLTRVEAVAHLVGLQHGERQQLVGWRRRAR
jgi:hypothetical protein